MKQVVLVDFCGTVVDFQTLNPYLEFVLKNVRPVRYYLFCNTLVKVACRVISKVFRNVLKIKFPYKTGLVKLLKGVKETEFIRLGREYYDDKIKNHLISRTLAILQMMKDDGCELMIVSGGSEFYISYFSEEFGVKYSITMKIGFEDCVCTGKIVQECIMSEKIDMINDCIQENGIDCTFVAGLSDSRSDLPMLDLCDDKIIISAGKHQKWVTSDMIEVVY